MKNAIIIAVALAVGFGAGWISKPIPTFEREELPQGGAEMPIVEPEPLPGYTFPIAEEDFLMKTSPFGVRVSPLLGIEMRHIGLDIAGVWQCQIVAIADGVIKEHYPPPGTRSPAGWQYRGHELYGGMILIDHGEGVESLYGHLSSTRVREGQRVRAGQVIGRQGATGKAVGAHLHIEIIVDDEPRNPLLYLPDIEEGRR